MTASTTFIDRYLDAAMRTVPERQRADLAAELRGSIDDQIEARIADGESPDAAERAVLTELGDPERLAAGYTDRPLWLIGPRYFLDWWRLLKLLLWIVPPLAAFAVALGQTISGAEIGEIIGTTVGVTFATVVQLAFWTTLVFAVVERVSTGSAASPGPAGSAGSLVPWSLEQLPEPRESGARFSDMIATVVFLLLGAGAIVWDRFIGFAPGFPGLSFLDPGLWPWWIGGLFVLMALEAIMNVVVFLRGRWTLGLAGVNALLNVVVTVPALWLLTQGRLLNPGFWTTIVPDDGATVGQIVAIVAGFGIAGIAGWDSVGSFVKAARGRVPVG